ncbi:hypothetical protein GOV06_04785 [Candidatus Woesearchaeota archaeon]|nr:hypothetical protein [Candidatus Woesearchaeota archaeon]
MKNIKVDTAVIVCVIYLLLAAAVLVFGMGVDVSPVGCSTSIFSSNEQADIEGSDNVQPDNPVQPINNINNHNLN